MQNKVKSWLKNCYPDEIAEALVDSYVRALGQFKNGNWQYFGNEVGQFVECARRIIEFEISGTTIHLSDKLPIFTERLLQTWETANPAALDEYRIVIPRILYAMYCIRNKRGMIHKSSIDPNKMDAVFLLYNTKWVLAEICRLNTNQSFSDAEDAINAIMNRESSLIWNTGKSLRILDSSMKIPDQVLCLLYVKDNQLDTELQNETEYSNSSRFKTLLKELHKNRFIEYSEGSCKLSPKGVLLAETLMQ